MWTGRQAAFDVVWVDIFVCYLYLIQLTDLSMCEGTDTMKIMVSDQLGAMLYFPPQQIWPSFHISSSHHGDNPTGGARVR